MDPNQLPIMRGSIESFTYAMHLIIDTIVVRIFPRALEQEIDIVKGGRLYFASFVYHGIIKLIGIYSSLLKLAPTQDRLKTLLIN